MALTACHNAAIVRARLGFVLPLVALLAVRLGADDGAASIAAGGIVVMKREPRITMAKEVLQISTKKVVVDYDFRNDSDENITTEVAFPIPDYEYLLERDGSKQGFEDFKLWVDGSPAKFQVEARAFLKDREYTQMLNDMHVDVGSYGHGPLLDEHGKSRAFSQDLERLTEAQRVTLRKLALIDPDGDNQPMWSVKKKYYWQQTFPAHKTVHIRHEYTPVLGSSNSVSYGLGANPNPDAAQEMASFCLDQRLHDNLQQLASSKDKSAWYAYVDFILTTANTWKTPIEDFTLAVERPHWKNNRGEADLADYVSFCWDGPVTRPDPDHFSAHTTNLVPTKELRVGFFGVEKRH